MTKTITYTGLAVSAILTVILFITAKTYAQLGIAVILYPLLAYFVLKVLPRKNGNAPIITVQVPVKAVQHTQEYPREKVQVADIDKRTFLKFIGGAGISFLVFSILGRRLDSLLFGGSINSASNAILPAAGSQLAQSTSPMDGYKISEIDEGDDVSYYGFVDQKGGWLIMRAETDSSSFRYARGASNFTRNWEDRNILTYDYYHKLF